MGNGPITNRGCEAIVLGTRKILRSEFGDCEILLASFGRDDPAALPDDVRPVALKHAPVRWSPSWCQHRIRQALGIPGAASDFLKPLRYSLAQWELAPTGPALAAAFSIGGDGYSIDYGHTIIDRLMVMDEYVKSRNIPVIVWGASIGPFDREPDFERAAARHFAQLDLIIVREPESRDYLKNLGVSANVRLAPDPAFALDSRPCELPDLVNRLLDEPCLGVNVSPLLARYATGGDIEAWRCMAAGVISALLAQFGLPIVLIPHVTSASRVAHIDDEAFLSAVQTRLAPQMRGRVATVPGTLNSEQLKWLISRMHAFVGARTHATIAALSSGVPCLSIAYSRKALGINDLIFGHRDWVLAAGDITPAGDVTQTSEVWDRVPSDPVPGSCLLAKVGKLLARHEHVRRQLSQVIPRMIADSYAAARAVREVLTSPQSLAPSPLAPSPPSKRISDSIRLPGVSRLLGPGFCGGETLQEATSPKPRERRHVP
jgi:polysaccharide pyruvyl transferase WcaK-like protein